MDTDVNKTGFKFPILIIKEVKPLLYNKEKVFAYKLTGLTRGGLTVRLYENKGLDLSTYIGHEMECLLEITTGKFEYGYGKENILDKAVRFKYQWFKRPFEFFGELIEMNKELQRASDAEEAQKRERFKADATKFFNEWGLKGLDIGIYQSKPVFSSTDGFFLVNEYEFEERIEGLELGEEVNIKIDEIFLRGIRPCVSSKEPKQKVIPQQKQKEDPKQPVLNEVSIAKKKGRFDNLLD